MDLVNIFKEKAKKLKIFVIELKDLSSVINYSLTLKPKEKKPIFKDQRPSEVINKKILGIYGLNTKALNNLQIPKDWFLVTERFRDYLGGIDIGIIKADFGIASTSTVIVESFSEDLRILTMVSEINVIVLEKKRIFYDFENLIKDLKKMTSGPNFLSFITGASKTADIERVLTYGVHGPFEIHIILTSEEI